ncbi:translocation/assembly module TamB domain-containing protein [Asaia astilbis]|uniref:translocation/assembly module TamB domain-containing protein n=1 Tax=Asaia astilbis TaxID=610244 RepID=UPI001E635558|nr:translocation/assembly module TamB domain-containing protein [Asaia astilbis]
MRADGKLDGRKLALDAAFSRHEDGLTELTLTELDWASLVGKAHLTLPPAARIPLGTLAITAGNLNDFSALAGKRLGGRLVLDLHTSEASEKTPPIVTLSLKGGVSAPEARIGKIDLGGTINDPVNKPAFNLKLALAGIEAQAIKGSAKLAAQGPLDALALSLNGAFQNVMAAPATLDTALLLDLPGKTVRLDRLAGLVKGETIRLSGRSQIVFGTEMGVDRLQLAVAPAGVAPATLSLAGTVKPKLNLHLRLAQVTPALAKPFVTGFDAAGVLSAQADLGGDIARPTGTASVTLHGFRLRNGPAASLPPLALQANTTLSGQSAQLTAQADAGKSIALRVAGKVPLTATGPIDVRMNGSVDLSVANAILGAQGMGVSGRSRIDLAVNGQATAPKANGQVTLENINFAHYGQGVRLTEINGAIVAANDSLTLQNVVAHAGKGTIGLSGSVGVLRPGLPIDIRIVARKAQPVTSDLLTAVIDTDLRAHGQLSSRLDVDGGIRLPSVVVNIPNSMPASVPQLTVIRPGEKQETSASSLVIGLDVSVLSPGSFFVRGHGLDAEMSGKLHVGGLSSAPDISGGFDLKRGFFNLAGVNLNFTKGRVAFDGSGVDHKLDPSLDFRADRNVQGAIASLVVGGYASAPKIDFASQPSLPRDQVLSMLLFGSSTASLSPTQLASLAAAVAQMTGGSSFDPLNKVRGLLGLDRLAVGGGSGVDNGGASLEAGKYVMKGVYVGAKQATGGTGTQAQVQVDLTKRLKLNTTVGTGGQVTGFTTPENDPGSSVGVSYGFDY